jgi:glucan phosphorylase
MNGAVTLGSQDGTNVEVASEVGPSNIFLFEKKNK